eukprot:1350115-Rhodomonas_salina.1
MLCARMLLQILAVARMDAALTFTTCKWLVEGSVAEWSQDYAHIVSWAEAQDSELRGRHFARCRNFPDADSHGDPDDFAEDLPSQEEVEKANANFLAKLEEMENHMQALADGEV